MKYIIRTPSFDITLGGVIALHRLCHLLRGRGEDAYLWPGTKPVYDANHPLRSFYRFVRYFFQNIFGDGFKTFSEFDTPIAKYSDLENAVVVYGEGVLGNPLLSKKIVRWFLHKPGFHTGKIAYGIDELYFYYQKVFDDSNINSSSDNSLTVVMLLDKIYKQRNYGERKGRCYAVRKGRLRSDIPNLENEVVIDELSHAQVAKIFNEVEYFISYDTETLYSVYAAMCGCKSIVVPEHGVTKEQWRPEERYRYGIAYGFDDIEYAIETKELLLERLEQEASLEDSMVENFIKKTKEFF